MVPQRSNALDMPSAPFLPEQELSINAIEKPINHFSGWVNNFNLILKGKEDSSVLRLIFWTGVRGLFINKTK